MKKTLIAVAALAATSAFAQVTITGTMDATFRMTSTDLANGTSYSSKVLDNDGIGTTGFTLSGMEDLGGGLKAVFLYEHNFEMTDTGGGAAAVTSTTVTGTAAVTGFQANGQMFVGLEGAFGSIKLGAPNTPTLTVQGARGAGFGTKDGGRLQGTFGTSRTRFDSSFLYTTPNLSGFSAALMYVPESESAVNTATGALTDMGLFYANGPLALGVSNFVESYDTAAGVDSGNKDTQTSFYGSYNLGFAKFTLGGHTQNVKNAAGVKTTDDSGYNVAADVPLSPALTLTANIHSLNDKLTANADQSLVAVGVQYAMSKRTMSYARYVSLSNDNVTGTAVKDSDTFLVGLRHNF